MTTQVVTTDEINALPTVAPALDAMRARQEEMQRVRGDRRSGARQVDAAEQAYAAAAETYRVAFQREQQRLYAERSPLA